MLCIMYRFMHCMAAELLSYNEVNGVGSFCTATTVPAYNTNRPYHVRQGQLCKGTRAIKNLICHAAKKTILAISAGT